jgi:hypothetical protein
MKSSSTSFNFVAILLAVAFLLTSLANAAQADETEVSAPIPPVQPRVSKNNVKLLRGIVFILLSYSEIYKLTKYSSQAVSDEGVVWHKQKDVS